MFNLGIRFSAALGNITMATADGCHNTQFVRYLFQRNVLGKMLKSIKNGLFICHNWTLTFCGISASSAEELRSAGPGP